MAFVSEKISTEEDKKNFLEKGFSDMLDQALNPNWWAIDREREIILVGRGGGAFEIPTGYQLYINGKLVELEVTEAYEGSELTNSLKVYWFIKKIVAPKSLIEGKAEIEKLKKIITEAFYGLGTEGIARDKLLEVNVKIMAEPVSTKG